MKHQDIDKCSTEVGGIAGCLRVVPGAIALGVGLILAGCKESAPAVVPPPVVEVMEVAPTNAPVVTEIIGQLDSPQNVEIRARVEAFVEEVLFVEGQPVEKGAPLFRLDEKPLRERLKAAEGLLAEAKAQLNKYEKDVARLTPLVKQKAVPLQDLDNAQASVEVGKAGVLSAKARVESVQLDLTYCDVRSPIAGLIGAKQVSVGELVGRGQPTLLATLSTLDPIWFYCAVSEVEYLKAEAETRRTGRRVSDMPATLILSDGSVHPGKGRFVFIDRAVDAKTGTLRVRAEFPNPEKVLRPGMFARIKVDLGTRADSILVPERAVTELQGKNFVWVIGPDNKAEQRPVKVGGALVGGTWIQEGLKAGERIVVEGVHKLREGNLVQLKPAGTTAAPAAGATAQPEAKPAKQ